MLSRALLLLLISPFVSAQSAQTTANPDNVADLISTAADAYRHSRYAEAAEKYRAAAEQSPTAAVFAGLERSYLGADLVTEARAAAEKALATDANSAAAHTAVAEVLFREGKFPEAEKEFIRAVQLDPKGARAYAGLSRIDTAISLYARAYKLLQKAHELAPDDPDISYRWMNTLPLSERIANLQARLADDSGDQTAMEPIRRGLESLKTLQQNSARRCRLVTNLEKTETDLLPIRIDPQHASGWGLDTAINGHTTRLLLDTGASGILIDRPLAEKIGVHKVLSTQIGGFGDQGPVSGYMGYADSIKIGQLEFQDCLVEVTEKRSLGDHGLIGADVFSDYLVDIDFPADKFRLTPLPKRPEGDSGPAQLKTTAAAAEPESADSKVAAYHPRDRYVAPEMKDWTQVLRFGHQLLVPTSINEGATKFFLLDTGSVTNLISLSAARESTKASRDADIRVRGISGEVRNVYVADKAVLRFARFRQENQDVTAFDFSGISRSIGTEISGALGYVLLQMLEIKIDYRDGLIDFIYDKEKLRRFK